MITSLKFIWFSVRDEDENSGINFLIINSLNFEAPKPKLYQIVRDQ